MICCRDRPSARWHDACSTRRKHETAQVLVLGQRCGQLPPASDSVNGASQFWKVPMFLGMGNSATTPNALVSRPFSTHQGRLPCQCSHRSVLVLPLAPRPVFRDAASHWVADGPLVSRPLVSRYLSRLARPVSACLVAHGQMPPPRARLK